MNLSAPAVYSQGPIQQLLSAITTAIGAAFARGQDVELARGERIILRSPNGSRFAITVSNAGTLGTTAL